MVLLVGLGAGLLLAGCAGDPVPEPTYGTPPVSTPTPTPTPTGATAPERPADMDRTDEAGAVAAATYFMELYDYARATGDTSEWDAISSATCMFCTNVSAALADVYGAGRQLEGGRTLVDAARVVGFDAQLVSHVVEVSYATEGAALVDSTGSVVEEYASESGWLVLELGPVPGGWQLLDGQQLDEPLP
jgi:hypothetical protein